jgi:hypothetical protein
LAFAYDQHDYMTNVLLTVLYLQRHYEVVEFADFQNTSFTAMRYSPGLSSAMARWCPGCRSAATWIGSVDLTVFPARSRRA